ncbi:MAG TPA: nascent polypeptide-associated complex protein [Methanocorpusculum sp.]|nr:nascent polypeptide-associated complex protein [Methanocorpusculum sp.]
MIPGINPKQMQMAMKKLGMEMDEIKDVQKVVVYTSAGNYIFEPAQVVGISMKGNTSYQLTGTQRFEPAKIQIPDSDIELVMSQASVSKEKALETLESCNGDIAETILKLTSNK